MFDSERPFFKSMLDTLADMLHVNRLEDWAKDLYFESLKRYSNERFAKGLEALQENYEPKRAGDFPVLKVIRQACESAKLEGKSKNPTWDCRCCKIPFPAGSERLNCSCLIWDHCFRCDKCHKHCPCELKDRISVEQISASCVAEFTRLMSQVSLVPSKRSRPEGSALKKPVITAAKKSQRIVEVVTK